MILTLRRFKQTLRPYQQATVDACRKVARGSSTLFASPTGTGKGTIELALLQALRGLTFDAVIVTPCLEVVRGFAERCEAPPSALECTSARLATMGQDIDVWTPVRLRNAIESGERDAPEWLIIDEAHHAVLKTISGGGLRKLCPDATWLGLTATAYRGTPEATQALKEMWGEPVNVLTIPEAVDKGYWALPDWSVRAIVDDDLCKLKGGDLNADEITLECVDPLADMIVGLDLSLPTCVTVNSVEAAWSLAAALEKKDIPTCTVLGTTVARERAEIYATVAKGGTVMVSVKVLGEGIDIPWLRRWVDASPTLSPVAFIQKLGRITRLGKVQPQYVGTNRNLERHAYLLQGLVPSTVIKEAQDSFGGASTRGARAGLIKGVGRAKPITLPLSSGVKATMWALYTPGLDGSSHEHCIILDPTSDRVISARRQVKTSDGKWGEYKEVPLPTSSEGFRKSKLYGQVSDKQLSWWDKAGLMFGLDHTIIPTRAQFYALPALTSLDISMDVNAPTPSAVRAQARAETETKATPTQTPEGPPASPQEPTPTTGYYTVVREDGTRRTYRIRTMPEDSSFAPGKTVIDMLMGTDNTRDYTGVGFAKAKGANVWQRFRRQRDEINADWMAIMGDVKGSGKRYAIGSGRCYVCGRLLTTPESVAAGIGPVCANKE